MIAGNPVRGSRSFLGCALVVCCICTIPIAGAQAPNDIVSPEAETQPASRPYQLTFDDGRVSVQAQDVSLQTILRDLASQAGFGLKTDLATDTRVTTDLAEVPLREAVRRLTEGSGTVVQFSEDQEGIQQVILMSQGAATPTETDAEVGPQVRALERPHSAAPFGFELDPRDADTE